jgi:predicted nucleic-acid-binding Zn-ribbon protein
MRNGKCSKCGSATIVTRPNGIVPGGKDREYISIDGSFLQAINTVTFLCTSCGYYERYVSDSEKLAQAAQKWQKVPPQG